MDPLADGLNPNTKGLWATILGILSRSRSSFKHRNSGVLEAIVPQALAVDPCGCFYTLAALLVSECP